MSASLIVPIYNDLQTVKRGMTALNLSEAADIAYTLIIGLSQHDGQLLEDWLTASSNNVAAFNLYVLEDSVRSDDVLTLYGPMKAIADSPTAISNMLNNSAVRAKVLLYSSALQAIAESTTAMSFVAGSQSVMQDFAASQVAMDAVVASQVAMTAVAASQVARNVTGSSQVSLDALAASPLVVAVTTTNTNSYANIDPLPCFLISVEFTSITSSYPGGVRYFENGTEVRSESSNGTKTYSAWMTSLEVESRGGNTGSNAEDAHTLYIPSTFY